MSSIELSGTYKVVQTIDPNRLDEWRAKFGEIATELGQPGNSNIRSSSPPPLHEFRFGDLPAILGLRGSENGDELIVVVVASTIEDSEYELIRKIAAEVERRFEEPDGSFEWVATIRVSRGIGLSPTQLSTASSIGDIELFPLGALVVGKEEWAPPSGADLNSMERPAGGAVTTSWTTNFEVGVLGKTAGRTWPLAQLEANQIVFDLCNLLTLEWGAPVMPSALPHNFPSQEQFRKQNEYRATEPLEGFEHRDMDDRVAGWFECVLKDSQLRDAVRIYAQAERVVENHPSLALVAYVGCIEAIGQRLYPPIECQGFGDAAHHCASCNRKSGAMRAFKVAIETTFDEPTAKRLKKEAYGLRSQTAHSGVLHGDEDGRNRSFALTKFGDRNDFRSKQYEIARVASRILQNALTECSS